MDRRRFIKSSVAAAVAASLPASQAFGSLLHIPTKVESDINAITGDGAEVTLSQAAVQEFSDSLKGKLLLPGSGGYDEARLLLNPSFDKHPALIAQPTGAADVSSAVSFARDNNLLVAVKCGGHSASGKSSCDNGLQIDLSHYRSVRVDTKARTARVAGGSLLTPNIHALRTARQGLGKRRAATAEPSGAGRGTPLPASPGKRGRAISGPPCPSSPPSTRAPRRSAPATPGSTGAVTRRSPTTARPISRSTGPSARPAPSPTSHRSSSTRSGVWTPRACSRA